MENTIIIYLECLVHSCLQIKSDSLNLMMFIKTETNTLESLPYLFNKILNPRKNLLIRIDFRIRIMNKTSFVFILHVFCMIMNLFKFFSLNRVPYNLHPLNMGYPRLSTKFL